MPGSPADWSCPNQRLAYEKIYKILNDAGFQRTHVSNSAARNERWDHPDGSQVRIHPYGNQQATPYKSGNNAHVHKEDSTGAPLNDRGAPDPNPSNTHIGMPNPQDLPAVRDRPHGEGTQ